mgnify:CR=1 FL=1
MLERPVCMSQSGQSIEKKGRAKLTRNVERSFEVITIPTASVCWIWCLVKAAALTTRGGRLARYGHRGRHRVGGRVVRRAALAKRCPLQTGSARNVPFSLSSVAIFI